MKDEILREAFRLFGIAPKDICGKSRHAFLLPVRFACYKAMRERGWSFPMIGRAMKRHHTSIMHGVDRAEYMASRNPRYAEKVHRLCTFDLAEARPMVKPSLAKPSPAQPDHSFCDT